MYVWLFDYCVSMLNMICDSMWIVIIQIIHKKEHTFQY